MSFAVDDHGGLEESLGGVSVARRPVEGERRPRSDQRVIDQMRDKLDVVDAIGNPAEVGRVAGDDLVHSHGLGVLARPLRLPGLDDDRRDPAGRRERCGEDAVGRVRNVQPPPCPVGDDVDRASVHGEGGVGRRPVDRLLQLPHELVGVRATDRDLGRAVLWQPEQLRDLPPSEAIAGRPELHVDRRAERDADAGAGGDEIGGVDGRWLGSNRQRDRLAAEAGERGQDRGPRLRPVNRATGAAGHDHGTQAPEDDGRVAIRSAGLSRDPGERETESTAVRFRRRRHAGSEHAKDRSLEAAHRTKAVTLATSRGDCAGPVDIDPYLTLTEAVRMPGGPNDERHLRQLRCTPLEEGRRLRSRQPANVDAGDRLALRERVGRACVDDGADQRSADQDGGEEHGAAPERASPRLTLPARP